MSANKQQTEKRGFTLVELLVVIAIIGVLLTILVPALQKAKKQAQAAVCLSNLHSWGQAMELYRADNDGKLFSYTYYADFASNPAHFQAMQDGFFMGALRKYHDATDNLRLCPSAKIADLNDAVPLWGSTFTAWGDPASDNPIYRYDFGSYCWNGWVHPFTSLTVKSLSTWAPAGSIYRDGRRYWGSQMQRPDVPVLVDGALPDAWPDENDGFADYDDQPYVELYSRGQHMMRLAVNRHSGGVNALFGDGSAAHVPLPDLWSLKWNKKWKVRSVVIPWLP